MALILRPAGTSLSLAERVAGLARGRQAWCIAGGVAGLMAFVASVVAVELVLDFAFTLPAAVRALTLALLLAGGTAIILRSVIAPMRRAASPQSLALALEAANPDLNDALASAVAFQQSPDRGAFHNAAIVHAQTVTEPLNWNRVLPLGRFWRNFWLASVAFVAVLAVAFVERSRIPTALARLADPWGGHTWPARTHLSLAPFAERIAQGDAWQLSFTVSGEVPESATVRFQSVNGPFEEIVPIQELHGLLTLDPSRTAVPFSFEALAGDAASGWHSVSVRPPPRLVPENGRASPRLHLDYPTYTGWTPVDLPDGSVTVEAVAGTRVTLAARTNRPIRGATLVWQGDRSTLAPAQAVAPLASPLHLPAVSTAILADGFANDLTVTVSGSDRQQLSISVIPPIAGVYALRFTDEDGITGQRLLDWRTFPDPQPSVALLRPDPVRDTMDRLTTAVLELDARADDRTFAVRSLVLEYRYADETWQTLPLVDLKATADVLPALSGSPVPFAASHPPTLQVRRFLEVAALRHDSGSPPAAGDVVVLRAAATDWDDVSLLKEPGRSAEVALRIHSPESLEAEIQRQLAALRVPLRQTLTAQEKAAKADSLDECEKSQADVRAKLADPRDGLLARTARLKQTQRDNRLSPSPTTARLEAVSRALAAVEEKRLAAIENLLTEARKNAAMKPALTKQQQAAARDLQSAAEELDRWAGLAELRSEALSLADQIRKAGTNLDRLRERLPAGVDADKLPASDKSALHRAAGELAAAADEAKALLGKADKVRETKQGQPDADKLDAAIEKAGGSVPADDLRKAAENTRGNRLSDAADRRASAENRLRAFEDALAARDAPDELHKKTKDLANRIADLQREQDELAKKAADAPDAAARESLGEEQERLRRKTERLAEEAEALGQSPETLKRAAQKMEQAAGDFAAGKDASRPAGEAGMELARAAEESKPKEQSPKSDLAREEQQQLQQLLKGFRDRQQAALDESMRLTDAAAKAGRWERPLIASLAALAEREEALARELRTATEKLFEDSPVFASLISQATRKMDEAARRLGDRKDDALAASEFVAENEAAADDAVRRPMREALRRLDQILQSLAEDQKQTPDAKAKPMPGGDPAEPGAKPQKPPPLAQLKALRDWQEEIRERTAAFGKAHPNAKKFNDDDRAELAELQKAQEDITALFAKLRESLTPKEALP